jgi:hypothetical protein
MQQQENPRVSRPSRSAAYLINLSWFLQQLQHHPCIHHPVIPAAAGALPRAAGAIPAAAGHLPGPMVLPATDDLLSGLGALPAAAEALPGAAGAPQ